ncbi:hypothetical protein O3G_MSEX012609 [Manduca sexta]|uniref:Uncharacterized protein n=1 Tax=Manduca sexta TaxID=7130 RepID=A0A921ZP83_MANSE|nr:hypothetical protein O3G_MSEX012609 [Manduca sexta]
MNRSCECCKDRVLNYREFENDKTIKYYQWCTTVEKYMSKGQEKKKVVSKKVQLQDLPLNVIKKLEDSIPAYFAHCNNVIRQYNTIKMLKSTLSLAEAVIHVDFSENYSLKYNEEIQSVHFGGSCSQITLHTSVIYLLDPELGTHKTQSYCTLSECNRHDAAAIWAHLIPLIEYILDISPMLDGLHFISDSPSSQYRNKHMFYAISQLYRDFPQIKTVTWNYLEAGHGKGAPDGVGATLKRTADQIVAFGSDIATFDDFVKAIKTRIKNIKINIVTEAEILTRTFPIEIKSFKGTMSVHQVLWSAGCPRMYFRELSCIICSNDTICRHGYHIGCLDTPCMADRKSTKR